MRQWPFSSRGKFLNHLITNHFASFVSFFRQLNRYLTDFFLFFSPYHQVMTSDVCWIHLISLWSRGFLLKSVINFCFHQEKCVHTIWFVLCLCVCVCVSRSKNNNDNNTIQTLSRNHDFARFFLYFFFLFLSGLGRCTCVVLGRS